MLTIVAYSQEVTSQTTKNTVQIIINPIDTFIERKMNECGLVGIGAAIIINKEVVWTKGYGYADNESKKPFTPNTIMNIGSIAKTITGV